MKKLTFNIIGAGAMGHLWTCMLLKHGFDVSLYSSNKQPNKTFQVKSPVASFEQVVTYKILAEWQDADVVLVCVKAHQLEALCLELSQCPIKPSPMILMMNGMGLVELSEEYLPQMQSIQASILQGAYIKQNKLIHTGCGETTLGNLTSQYAILDFIKIVDQLNQVLPTVSWSDNHLSSMYLKLFINAIINPICALANQSNGHILTNGQLNHSANTLLKELSPLIPELLPNMDYVEIKKIIEQVAQSTHLNICSMLQDVRAHKPTEIDFINGYLLEWASQRDISLPKHAEIIYQIKQL